MRTRFNIFGSLEASFLSLQTKIRKLRQGSIMRSLLYSVASELETVYGDIDVVKNNSYIDTAQGEFLDSLIEGFFKVKRRPATHASGYIVLELSEPLTVDNVEALNFSFSQFNQTESRVRYNYRNTVKIQKRKEDVVLEYFICQPLSYETQSEDFDINPITGEQQILTAYKEYLVTLINALNSPIKRLVLPIVAKDPGRRHNLQAEEMETIINIGIPAVVKNLFYVEDCCDVEIADVDNVLSSPQGTMDPNVIADTGFKVLGDYSYITGGDNEENDDKYRERFYLYLDSFSRGTLASLEYAVKTFIANVKVKAIESGVAGYVTIFVDSPQVISKNLLSRVNEIVRDYRSAGILVNLRPTKVEFVNVLVDVDANSLEAATERARSALADFIDGKELEQTLTYTDIHEAVDVKEIRKADNVYYGYFLTPELSIFICDIIDDVYSQVIDNYDSECATYKDLMDTILEGNVKLFERGNPDLKYPLVHLVRAAKEMPVSSLPSGSEERRVVQAIQDYCSDVNRASSCLDRIQSEMPEPEVGEPEFSIKIRHLETLVGKWYSNYFKIKFMTIPPIKGKNFIWANDLVEKFVLNDVINLTYEDLTEADLPTFSKLRLTKNFAINEKLYKINSLVATRKIER